MVMMVLLFAHLVADYPLQGDFLAKMKGSNFLILLTHCGIWTGCVCVAGHVMGLPIRESTIALLFAVHGLADIFKAKGLYGKADPLGWPLWVDQSIHVVQLAAWIIWRY